MRNKMNECYDCAHLREVPGNAHIRCVEPDPAMTGNAHGVKMGWFFYPLLFDPTWKTKDCANFTPKPAQNPPPRSANGLEPQGGPL